jgi:hypothetical protein
MGSGSVGSGFGVRGLVLLNRTRPPDFAPSSETPGGYVGQAVLEEGTGLVGAPIVQSNPVCSTYLHIVVERLFEHEDEQEHEHDFEAFCGSKNLLT